MSLFPEKGGVFFDENNLVPKPFLSPLATSMTININDIEEPRTFSLEEIVDYCKGAVEWSDVRGVVVMLNKLLRRTGTDEELDLVDSIEREFSNRKYGGTHIEHQTVIPNVGTYNAEVKEQNNNFPAMPFGQQGQKHLE